jgi:penicillin amidase
MNAPGQSGDPRSAHYRDLAEPWSVGAYVPLLYSPSRVEDGTVMRIRLLPRQ